MGLYLSLHTISEDNARAMLADLALATKWLHAEEEESSAAQPLPRRGWWARLLDRVPAPRPAAGPAGFQLAPGEGRTASLDKAWHGLHYLLTQTSWEGEAPLNALLAGGVPVGDEDAELGDARLLLPHEVARLHAALAPLDHAALRARFDPARMMELDIYPPIWTRDPAEDDSFGYCALHFDVLKRFVAEAAGQGMGVLIHVA